MLIQKSPQSRYSAQTSQRFTLSEENPKDRPQAAVDGFYRGADLGASLLIGVGTTTTSMAVVGAGLYGLFNDSGVGVMGGLVVGGPIGVGLGILASKGLDKVGAALDTANPQRGAALTKTAVVGLGSAILGDGPADALSSLTLVGAGGGLGAGLGYMIGK